MGTFRTTCLRTAACTLAVLALTLGDARAASSSPVEALQGIPGMDFSSLSPSAQQELGNVLTDEFCFCGCPHALGACLRNHTTCRHARRMAKLAASMAATGLPATDITNALSTYYLSFREPRLSFTPDERMCSGSKDAKVTLVEFFDFECPYCGYARPMLAKFVKANPKVRLCASPFPLPQHPNALPAGRVALYAKEKGKYWAMHDALFENQTHLSVELIKELAAKAGLSAPEVDKALASEMYAKELDGFKALGLKAHVDSTPTVFLNGHKLTLNLTADVLSQAVEDELEWTANHGAWAPDGSQ